MDTLNKPNALIIRPSALGDTLLLAPTLSQMADKVEITLVGRGPGVDLLRPFLQGCLDYERGGWHRLFLEWPHCRDLSFPQVDRVISFVSDPAGKVRAGLGECLRDTPVFSYPPFPPGEEKIHVALYLASCLKRSGLPVDPEEAIAEARSSPVLEKGTPSRSGSTVVLHPGSGSRKKNYPPHLWLDLIRGEDLGVFRNRTVLLGPAEEHLYQFFAGGLSGVGAEIVVSPHRGRLLSLLREARLCIGHDSGITHLAAMLGTPTIALFRNSHPLQWAPLGPDVTVITEVTQPRDIRKKIKVTLRRVRKELLS
jgi:heptosyltransferase-3